MALLAPAAFNVSAFVALAPPIVSAELIAMLPAVCRVRLPVAAFVVVASDTVMLPAEALPNVKLAAVIWLSSAWVRLRVLEVALVLPTSAPPTLMATFALLFLIVTAPVPAFTVPLVASISMESVATVIELLVVFNEPPAAN